MFLRCALLVTSFMAIVSCRLGAVESMSRDEMRSAVQIESITIPTPGEFFAAMNKQGQPNWTQIFLPQAANVTSSREQMALMLGVLVADGYIAVEAQDGQGVKNTGKEIIGLAKKLNVGQSILGRGSSISDFAENNEWSTLREELDATQNEVKLAMAEQKDQNLVILVTIGAWVGGVDVASRYIEKNYSPALAELLRQPAIIQYLLSQLAKLPDNMRADPLIRQLNEGLVAARKLVVADASEPLSPEAVASLSAIMLNLVKAISEDLKNP